MGWPEYTYITLTFLGAVFTVLNKETISSKIASFIAQGFIYFLLIAGGFFQ